MYKQEYLFSICDSPCDNSQKQSAIHVKAADLYSPEQGYGFIMEENMQQQPELMLPELNGGFLPVPWYHLSPPLQIRQEKYGCGIHRNALPEGHAAVSLEEMRRQLPLRFKCAVPSDGSYRMKITIRSEEEVSDIRIFTGRRCLAAYQDRLPAGEIFSCEAYTEVCGIIPRGQEQPYDNRNIELSITADKPCISALIVESIDCPVLYIAGDSTVTDQSAQYPYAPQASYAGWGQILPYFIKGALTVSNHSHSGLTTESFRQEGHAEIPMSRMKAGDYMLFQFGHNDQKLQHLKAKEGYCDNLRNYIDECRAAGVYPILVTPVARNTWRGNDGSYNDLLEEYAQACLALGEQMSVPVLDLHRLSMEFVIRLQKERAKKYFFPSDYTHHNDYGAQQMAAMICREIERVCTDWRTGNPPETAHGSDGAATGASQANGYRRLATMIRKDAPLWEEPLSMEPLQQPEGFSAEEEPEEFAEPDRPADTLLRAEALDMVIRRAGFFITNVYNDYFTDIVGHEWYAGAVECGLQNGIITKDMYPDKKFEPLAPVTLLDFSIFLMMAYGSRRTLPDAASCPYDNTAAEPFQSLVSAACQLGVLAADGTDSLNGHIDRHTGAQICRKLKIL